MDLWETPTYWISAKDPNDFYKEVCVPITDPVDLLAYYICEPGFRGHFRSTGMTRYEYRQIALRVMEKFEVNPKMSYDTVLCESCGQNPADLPSKICVGCDAYREHQA